MSVGACPFVQLARLLIIRLPESSGDGEKAGGKAAGERRRHGEAGGKAAGERRRRGESRGKGGLEQKILGILVNNAGLGQLFEPCEERLPQAKQMPVRHAQRLGRV